MVYVYLVLIAEREPPENTHYVNIKDHDDQQCFDKLIIAANHSKMSYHNQIYHFPPWWTISSQGCFAELGLGSSTASTSRRADKTTTSAIRIQCHLNSPFIPSVLIILSVITTQFDITGGAREVYF